MFCRQCGNQLEEGAKFCGRCGSPTTEYVAPVQPITPPAYVYPTQPAKPPKKVSAGAIISLILSLSPVYIILGILMASTEIGAILAIAGVLFFVPALIVSLVTFIKGFGKYKRDRMKPDFVIRNVAFAVLYTPCLLIALLVAFRNPLMYAVASNSYESGDYIVAYNVYDLLGDYKDSSEQAENSILSELEGNWKDPDYPASGFIRITFDGDRFESVVMLDGEVYQDPDLMVSGNVTFENGRIYLRSDSGQLYLSFSFSTENARLEIVDNTGERWVKYE